MAATNFGGTETRQQEASPDGYARLDAAERPGSDLGLDKPSAHGLLVELTEQGYPDAECHTSGSESVSLRYAEVRGLTGKVLG